MRKNAREVAFEVIFASYFTGEQETGLKNALYKNEKLDADDKAYADRVLNIVAGHSGEFLKIIDERSEAFPESRLFPADKSVLLLALAEIYYMDDIPDVVSANEAANIASKFSSPRSASFVSGILSEIIREK